MRLKAAACSMIIACFLEALSLGSLRESVVRVERLARLNHIARLLLGVDVILGGLAGILICAAGLPRLIALRKSSRGIVLWSVRTLLVTACVVGPIVVGFAIWSVNTQWWRRAADSLFG